MNEESSNQERIAMFLDRNLDNNEFKMAKVNFENEEDKEDNNIEGNINSNIFEILHPSLKEVMRSKGLVEPTLPQRRAIPKILEGKNVLLISPTGMGKTESAMLPLFHKILNETPKPIALLYITPLRALNRDMLQRMHEFGDALGIGIGVRHGDTSQSERIKMSKNPPQILITTPETFQILFLGRNLREHLKNVRYVIIDEVHELAEDERGAQLAIALERLYHLTKREFQRIGLSATIGSIEEVARYLVGLGREIDVIKANAEKKMEIEVFFPKEKEDDGLIADKIRCERIVASALRECSSLIKKHKSTLFFVNTRDHAEGLGARLKIMEPTLPIGVHHGSLSKEVRMQMEDEFKSGILKSLICTSSLELGIDIGSADYTIQYNSPRQVTRLVQRLGRSGHKVCEVSKGSIITTILDDIAESSVISRKALIGELEKFTVREKPLSVLANQLVGFVMVGEVNIREVYSVIRRAYPFRGLTEEELERVISQLEGVRILRRVGETLRKGGRSLKYFFENLSMIPDEKTYKIIDIVSRRFVGTLDESFVATFAQEGAKFISWGKSWQVVEIEGENVRVVQSDEIGAVPSWLGEEIPVPFSVAQEVGKIRGYIERQIKGNKKKEDTIAELRKYYPTEEHAFAKFYEYIKGHAEKYPVPTDSRITVEQGNGLVIINACFGSNVNETLGRALSALIASKYGFTVGLQVDAYRIILEVPFCILRGEICEMLKNIQPESLHLLLKIILGNSSYLRYQLYHVGRKFGAIEKGADFNILSIPKLLESFQNTPIYDEAIDKVIWEKMDIGRAREVLERIRLGKIEIVPSDISIIGLQGVERSKELMRPEKADKGILHALKVRLEKENVRLACFSCKGTWTSSVGELPDKIKCIFCGAVLVAALSPKEESAIMILKIHKNKKLNDAEKKKLKKIVLNAELVSAHGKKAIMALMARGVGPDTAARILLKPHQNEDEFLRDVLSAEVNYAKTRQFWR